jgi:hypothetical protein
VCTNITRNGNAGNPNKRIARTFTGRKILQQRGHELSQHEEQRHVEHDSGWLMLEMGVAENPNNSTPHRTS